MTFATRDFFLVKRVYARHDQVIRGEALTSLGALIARDFFKADTANDLGQRHWQADLFYEAQDIGDMRIFFDPDQPMPRGMIKADSIGFLVRILCQC